MIFKIFFGLLQLGIYRTNCLRIKIPKSIDRIQWQKSSVKSFEQSFVKQKNYILLDKLKAASKFNLTAAADEFVNFCDESFDVFIQDQISLLLTEDQKQELGKIRYEVNSARQRKLRNADGILRSILTTGGLKQMEAKLMYYLKNNQIDMAFMVILQLNIEDAYRAESQIAVQVMTHLKTIITEYQDSQMSPPVRLIRLLVRTEDSERRKNMLIQKLNINSQLKEEYFKVNARKLNVAACQNADCGSTTQCSSSSDSASTDTAVLTTLDERIHDHFEKTAANQCEHIVINPSSDKLSSQDHNHDHEHSHSHDDLEGWPNADVNVQELNDTIDDVISQIYSDGNGSSKSSNSDELSVSSSEIMRKMTDLKNDLSEVLSSLKYYELVNQ